MICRKEADGYIIEPSFGDIESYNESGSEVTLSKTEGGSNTKGTTVKIVLPEEFIYAIQGELGRTFARGSLDLPFEKASVFSRNMCNFPLPASQFYSENFPEISEDLYQQNIAVAKEIDSTVEITGSLLVHIGIPSRLIFQLDSKNISVQLISMVEDVTIKEDHPFCVTEEFVIESDDEESNSSSGDAEISQISPYGKVVIVEEDLDCGFFETSFALFQERKEYENCVETANYYTKVINEQFWLTPSVVKIEKKDNDLGISAIAGIEAKGNAFSRISLEKEGLNILKYKRSPGLFSVAGTITMQHAIGEMAYPGLTILAGKRSHFDIVSDSEYWTTNGPMVAEYNEGQSNVEKPAVMFSWENRETLSVKVSTMTASRLPNTEPEDDTDE